MAKLYNLEKIQNMINDNSLSIAKALILLSLFKTNRQTSPKDKLLIENTSLSGAAHLDRKLIASLKNQDLIFDIEGSTEQITTNNQPAKVSFDDLVTAIYSTLTNHPPSPAEIFEVEELVRNIQDIKTQNLAVYISKSYEIPIEDSRFSLSSSQQLSASYSIEDLLPVFHWSARKTKKFIKRNRPKKYISGKIFYKEVNLYFRNHQKNSPDIKNYWKIPLRVKFYPLEEIFNAIYLSESHGWNSLSSREIIKLFCQHHGI